MFRADGLALAQDSGFWLGIASLWPMDFWMQDEVLDPAWTSVLPFWAPICQNV